MPYSRLLSIVVTSIATSAVAATLHADETGAFLDYASLRPESREVGRRPMTYAQIVKRDRARREEKPLVDFAFAFSKAVAGVDHSNPSGGIICRKQDKVAASMQHQDVVIAELEAREIQIADDLEVAAPLSDAPAYRGDSRSERIESDPLDFRKALKAAPASQTSGWSGMTLAVRKVAMRFVDEGATQYR